MKLSSVLHSKNEHARAGPYLDAIIEGGGGEYSYIHVHIPQRKSLSKEIRRAEDEYIYVHPPPPPPPQLSCIGTVLPAHDPIACMNI